MAEVKKYVSTSTTIGRFVRFVGTSLISGFLIDKGVAWLLYNVLRDVMGPRHFRRILLANIIARSISLAANYALNRRFVFTSNDHGRRKSDVPNKESLPRYLVLAAGILVLSTTGVWWASQTFGVSEVIAKLGVDGALFFVNYLVQTRWVFKSDSNSKKALAIKRM